MIISLARPCDRTPGLRQVRLIPGSGRSSLAFANATAGPGAQRSLFCLAPHGVFRAPPITRRAVGSYPAFSPLPARLSARRRFVFCDTFRDAGLSPRAPAHSTRHGAWRCSDFPLHSFPRSDHRPPGSPSAAASSSASLPFQRFALVNSARRHVSLSQCPRFRNSSIDLPPPSSKQPSRSSR